MMCVCMRAHNKCGLWEPVKTIFSNGGGGGLLRMGEHPKLRGGGLNPL